MKRSTDGRSELEDDRCIGGGRANRVFGYARVSARDQNLARQMDALRAFPVRSANIYADKSSGKNFDRPQYRALVRRLRMGDVVVVKSIDRLGRNYAEILEEWRYITKKKGVFIVVLDMPLLDTRTQRGDITGVFLCDVVLQLLSYVAQIERENIHQRQAEGIAAAKARGVRFGRPALERPADYEKTKQAFEGGALTRKQAAALLNVSESTFSRWSKSDAKVGGMPQ